MAFPAKARSGSQEKNGLYIHWKTKLVKPNYIPRNRRHGMKLCGESRNATGKNGRARHEVVRETTGMQKKWGSGASTVIVPGYARGGGASTVIVPGYARARGSGASTVIVPGYARGSGASTVIVPGYARGGGASTVIVPGYARGGGASTAALSGTRCVCASASRALSGTRRVFFILRKKTPRILRFSDACLIPATSNRRWHGTCLCRSVGVPPCASPGMHFVRHSRLHRTGRQNPFSSISTK